MAAVHTFKHVRVTQDELVVEATLRFGADPMLFAFQCPTCDDVATIGEWKELGDPGRAGQECIGRKLGALKKPKATNKRGCDWAAYGLFRGPWEIVIAPEGDQPERSIWGFPLAGEPHPDGPVAAYLEARAAVKS